MIVKPPIRLSNALKAVVAGVALLVSASASATLFHGVEFPGGVASFADSAVSYDPSFSGGTIPNPTYQDTTQALGAPNYPEGTTPEYVSLGSGGRIVLRFTDNSLTGSGSAALDLWIFEVGSDVEDTFVEISKDGSTWSSVGKVFGATAGINIDAFGFGPTDFFSFIRLTDDPTEGSTSGATVGADIDAVGAITTAPPVGVPEPSTLALLAIGAAAAAYRRRKPVI